MDNHGSALLMIIHGVHGHPPIVLNNNPGDEVKPPSGSPATSNVVSASSDSKSHAKPQVKKGLGNQQCGACQAPGHNSKYIASRHCCVDIYTVLESNPQCPKKGSTSLPANSNSLV